MNVILISPYELGRQPFGLAEPAAWLRGAGFHVGCLDLSLDRLDAAALESARLIAIYVAMHTATRIAVEAIPRIRERAPRAHLCAYGLYAPVNEGLLRTLGVETVLGGEYEPGLLALAERLRAGHDASQINPLVNLSKIPFAVPDRSGMPDLTRYARLHLPDGTTKTVGFVEASRGCKHLCRHCPVVPVYQGRFRVVPVDVVLADIRNQVAAGAEHVSFGDPDFLNGPTHALKIVRALHDEYPGLTYDATIKIEHVVKSTAALSVLKETGCLFITSAVESVDDRILEALDKGHTDADFGCAVRLLHRLGIALAPTFVPFTPWTTLKGYVDLLRRLMELELIESVPPIQLAIRLLIPQGSLLLRLADVSDLVEDFDPQLLGYPWRHSDPRVDALQRQIQQFVEDAEGEGIARREVFSRIWYASHHALGIPAPRLSRGFGQPVPHLSEPWYCCAEPTQQQLQGF